MPHQLTDERPGLRVTRAAEPGVARSSWVRAALVVGVFALVGVGLGVLWEQVWHPSQGVVVDHQWFVADEQLRYDHEGLRNQFAGTGLFVLLGLGGGALLGGLTALLARRDEVVVLGSVTLGSVLAAVAMWQVGVHLGPADPRALALDSARGTVLPDHLELGSPGALLVWPFGALLALCTVFLLIPGRHRE